MQREKKNIYTDSKYAFTTLHGQEVICKERGLLTTGEKRLKKKKKKKYSNCWKQSGNHLKWLSCTAEAMKGTQMMVVEETA
jgi:hypothetical protein